MLMWSFALPRKLCVVTETSRSLSRSFTGAGFIALLVLFRQETQVGLVPWTCGVVLWLHCSPVSHHSPATAILIRYTCVCGL